MICCLCGGPVKTTPTSGRYGCEACGAVILEGRIKHDPKRPVTETLAHLRTQRDHLQERNTELVAQRRALEAEKADFIRDLDDRRAVLDMLAATRAALQPDPKDGRSTEAVAQHAHAIVRCAAEHVKAMEGVRLPFIGRSWQTLLELRNALALALSGLDADGTLRIVIPAAMREEFRSVMRVYPTEGPAPILEGGYAGHELRVLASLVRKPDRCSLCGSHRVPPQPGETTYGACSLLGCKDPMCDVRLDEQEAARLKREGTMRWHLCRHDILKKDCAECRTAPEPSDVHPTPVQPPTSEVPSAPSEPPSSGFVANEVKPLDDRYAARRIAADRTVRDLAVKHDINMSEFHKSTEYQRALSVALEYPEESLPAAAVSRILVALQDFKRHS